MSPMNVIVVVCNSLHLGFLGAYGNAWIETPNLDRLAAEDLRERGLAQAGQLPAVASPDALSGRMARPTGLPYPQ